jgi:hypothetical protein
MCENIRLLWQLIEKKKDYTDQDVNKLHIMCNKFMEQWVTLFGPQHMTKYIHVMGAGHLTFFAAKYRNLYRFSQQGWEALNQLLKHYLNNTNHGGAAGNGFKNREGEYTNEVISGDHCRPLMQLCQRSIMWKLGIEDFYFEGLSNGTIKSNSLTMKNQNVDDDYEEKDKDTVDNPITFGIL